MKNCISIITALFLLTSCSTSLEEKHSSEDAVGTLQTKSSTIIPEITTLSPTTPLDTTPSQTIYDNAQDDGYIQKCRNFIKTEKTNGIRIGTEYQDVVNLFGEPCKAENPSEGDDGWMQKMFFGDEEICIKFIIEDDTKKVNSYSFNKNTNAETSSGIHIGSSRQDVINVYGDWINIDESVWLCNFDSYANYVITPDTINQVPILVIGGMYQGCLGFCFDENDKISCIFAENMTQL